MATMPMADAMEGRAKAKKPGILRNSALNMGGLVVGSGLGALSGYITARVLGAEGVGILAVVFGLMEFGRGLTNFTHTPSILEVHRGADEGSVFGTSLGLKFIGSFLFLGIAALLDDQLVAIFDIPPYALLLTATLLGIGSLTEIATARYEARNQMFERNVLNSIGPAAGLLAVVAFVWAGMYNVYTAIATSLIGTAVMSLGFHLHWRHKRFRWDSRIARYLVDYGGRLVLSSFLTQVLLWTDTLMISAILGNAAAGVYNVVFQLTFVMVTASIAIGVALIPAMSELVARGEDTTAAYHRGTLLALALSVSGAVFFLLFGWLILGLYGAEFRSGYLPLLVLTVFGAAGALLVPAQSMLTVHGKATQLLLLSLAQAVLNVPVNYLLIGRFGILGASIATTTIFVVGLGATWMLVHRTTGAWPLSRTTVREGWAKVRQKGRALRPRHPRP